MRRRARAMGLVAPLAGARGQAAIEYLGVTVASALVVLAIAAGFPEMRSAMADALDRAACTLTFGDNCFSDQPDGPFSSQTEGDTDSDGLGDDEERRLGLAWDDIDSDNDGLTDWQEVRGPLDSFPSGSRTDPDDPDSDDDGLTDGQELRLGNDSEQGYVFDPLDADADGDGLRDAQELALGTSPDREYTESEGGGFETLSDLDEVFKYGTDPLSVDTDGDGEWDNWEIRDGTDPLVDERSGLEKFLEAAEELALGNPIDFIGAGGAGVIVKKGGSGLKALSARLAGAGADDVATRIDDAARRLDEALNATGQSTVIGKLDDLQDLRAGENTLLKHLPDRGSPKANWKQNSGVLRREMNKGKPIRDASVDPATGKLLNNTGFLRLERNLLESRGWTYDERTTLWMPPG